MMIKNEMPWIIFCATLISLVFVGGANADPPWVSNTWYINGATGDDANGGTNPGNDAVKTWGRVLQLVDNDSHARVIWAGRTDKDISDTPTAIEAMQYVGIMADRGRQVHSQEIVSGHGALPVDIVDTSSVGGMGISQQYIWETFENAQGTQERCIGITEVVVPEDYDPVP